MIKYKSTGWGYHMLEKQITALSSKNNNVAYQALKELQKLSEESNEVYAYLSIFMDMINSDNSYLRMRGLTLIAINARWDSDHQIDKIISQYLQHITDEKPIAARQCLQMLPLIAQFKPELKDTIIAALQTADFSHYVESMQPLVRKDRQKALVAINAL